MSVISLLRPLVLALTLTLAVQAVGGPAIINYQGRIAVGTPAVNFDGAGRFKFALVSADATTSYWSNDASSVAGSEPVAAVVRPVTRGLYAVALGDPAAGDMAPLPSFLFTNPDIHLRVWFDDGGNGFQQLAPDQRIGAVGYALVADLALAVPTGSISADQLAAGSSARPVGVSDSTWNAEANTAYTALGTGETEFRLPTTGDPGDTIQVTAVGAGGWRSDFPGWTPRESVRFWSAIASSADGRKLVAAVFGGPLYTSTDGGVTWMPRDQDRPWVSVASSADGTRLIATSALADGEQDPRGTIRLSSDSGATWRTPSDPVLDDQDGWWSGVASSADGRTLVALNDGFAVGHYLHVSNDFGTTWVRRLTDEPRQWKAAASSADGTRLVAVDQGPEGSEGGWIHVSSNAGLTWTRQGFPARWGAVAASADGTRLVAAAGAGGSIWTSTDAGLNWETGDAPSANWSAVASSADGLKLAAAVDGRFAFTSTDGGTTWIRLPDGANRSWTCLASSADGHRLAAGVRYRQLYTASRFSGSPGTTTTLVHLGTGEWVPLAQASVAAGAVGSAQIAPGAVGNAQLEANLTLDGRTVGTFVGDGSGLTNLPSALDAIEPPLDVFPAQGMVWIRPGNFLMGSRDDEQGRFANEVQHPVTLTRGYWIGVHEVTQAEYGTVTGRDNPSAFPDDANRPVEQVSWHDAMAYAATLTATERAAGRIPPDWAYRLPTEAEWEYACRAGARTTRFAHGDDLALTALGDYAWTALQGLESTQPVEQRRPNAWGLLDMHGNVFEWCLDLWEGSPYPGGTTATVDPLGNTGTSRVQRGGSWGYGPRFARSAYRDLGPPDQVHPQLGFRVVLAPALTLPPPVGMVLVPAGAFTMGDGLDETADAVPVVVSVAAFFMDGTEVTKDLWDEVAAWGAENGYVDLSPGDGKAPDHPVQMVTWFDCAKWCNARSEREGKAPAYFDDPERTAVYRNGQRSLGNLQVDWSADGYRLPTEAEWERAARGGLEGQRFPWGEAVSHELANYIGDAGLPYDQGTPGHHSEFSVDPLPYTSPVGSFPANVYGLHDVAGNVVEWCWDRYPEPFTAYAGGSNPTGGDSGWSRILRGGSWDSNASSLRTAYRNGGNGPDGASPSIGFRTVRRAPQP